MFLSMTTAHQPVTDLGPSPAKRLGACVFSAAVTIVVAAQGRAYRTADAQLFTLHRQITRAESSGGLVDVRAGLKGNV
jgi:hypothetical protein